MGVPLTHKVILLMLHFFLDADSGLNVALA